MKASIRPTPRSWLAAAHRRDDQHLAARLSADPVEHAHAIVRAWPVLVHAERSRVVGTAAARAQVAEGVPHRGKDQHPAALELKLLLTTEIADERVKDPRAKHQQRDADDTLHDGVDPLR